MNVLEKVLFQWCLIFFIFARGLDPWIHLSAYLLIAAALCRWSFAPPYHSLRSDALVIGQSGFTSQYKPNHILSVNIVNQKHWGKQGLQFTNAPQFRNGTKYFTPSDSIQLTLVVSSNSRISNSYVALWNYSWHGIPVPPPPQWNHSLTLKRESLKHLFPTKATGLLCFRWLVPNQLGFELWNIAIEMVWFIVLNNFCLFC